jgi:hypothetical protein
MFWCGNAAYLPFPRIAFRTALEVGSVTVLFLTLNFAGLAAFENFPSPQSAAALLIFVFYCF